jgi:uncharacterized protein (TIGR01244 family)
MSRFRPVAEGFIVAPQIDLEDLEAAAAAGVVLVINNRPDGEEPGQPASAEVARAADALGLAYRHIPVRGGPGPVEVETMRAATSGAEGPVLAYCRSGTRSILTWALGQAVSGERTRAELVALGQAAGYDLDRMLPAF